MSVDIWKNPRELYPRSPDGTDDIRVHNRGRLHIDDKMTERVPKITDATRPNGFLAALAIKAMVNPIFYPSKFEARCLRKAF